ncbi:MAG: DUF4372 domain-containing protein [Terriglobia bacterium]
MAILSGHSGSVRRTHLGKTVFAQLTDFIPAQEFGCYVNRYRGDRKLGGFSCWDQFLSMAFAQLVYRESLRHIETCVRAFGSRLYHLGLRGQVSPGIAGRCQRESQFSDGESVSLHRVANQVVAQLSYRPEKKSNVVSLER